MDMVTTNTTIARDISTARHDTSEQEHELPKQSFGASGELVTIKPVYSQSPYQ